MNLLSFVLMMTSLVFVSSAQAQSIPENCHYRNFTGRFQDLLHTVAIVDDDDRRTERKYAEENGMTLEQVKKKFAATGQIKCGRMIATAQVTYKNNVITTAGHLFTGNKTCDFASKPTDCTFTTQVDGKAFVSKIKEMVGTGHNCPDLPKPNDDWAVLKLEVPAPDAVEPYALPEAQMKENEDVIQVAASSVDFYYLNSKTGKRGYPKHLGNCKTKKVYIHQGKPIYFSSNCDTSDGASGGGILRNKSGRFEMLGMTVNNDESEEQVAKATRGKVPNPNRGAYSEGKWAVYNVPVEGGFKAAIKRAGDFEDL